jgi:Ulp1 family protease
MTRFQAVNRKSELSEIVSFHDYMVENTKKTKTGRMTNLQRFLEIDNFFTFERVFIPIHTPGHWSLVIVDNKSGNVLLMDSYNSMFDMDMCNDIREWLNRERIRLGNTTSYEFVDVSGQVANQGKSRDCGVYVAYFALCFMLDRDPGKPFDVDTFRRRMCYDILTLQISNWK